MNKQASVIIFKIYRNSMDGDYHDLMIDAYSKIAKELKAATDSHNRELILISNFADNVDNIIVNTPYLEVLYSDELTREEKELYIGIVKKLFSDGGVSNGTIAEHIPECIVRFSPLPGSDSFEVIPKSESDNMVSYLT